MDLPRVHVELVATGVVETLDEIACELKVFVVVDTDAELDRDWNRPTIFLEALYEFASPFCMLHEDGAELLTANAIRGTPHVQVDLVVAIVLHHHLAREGGVHRVDASDLTHDGVFQRSIVVEMNVDLFSIDGFRRRRLRP
jgi:hypothetical protein